MFCTIGDPPPPDEVMERIRRAVAHLSHGGTIEIDNSTPMQFRISFSPRTPPVLIEIERRRERGGDSLVQQEIAELLGLLDEIPDTANRRRVESHLAATRFVVAAQIPTANSDDEAWEVVDAVLQYFTANHGGMIQADGEGFYADDSIIVALE